MRTIAYSIILGLLFVSVSTAQVNIKSFNSNNIFKTDCFVENKGQFELMQDHAKNILYAVQNNGDEIYFTKKGLSIKVSKIVLKEGYKEEDEKEIEKEDEEEELKKHERKTMWVDVEWLHTNANYDIKVKDKTTHYFTYGEEKYCSYGYKSILYKNIYNNIDIEYSIHPQSGIEYTLILHPGANLKDVMYSYKGKNVQVINNQNELIIKNDIKDLIETKINAYYENNEKVKIHYAVNSNNEINFYSTIPLDNTKKLIIDPWITSITTLSGIAGGGNNTGYDIDNDALGNLFVFGGGGDVGAAATCYPKVAKYDVSGVLLWTFSGVVVTPAWNSSPGSASGGYARAGNFCVNKQNSKTYISQGLNVSSTGAIIVRINSAGVYDNYITNTNTNFQEIWDMKINCATSQVMGIGGGTNSNINFGIVDTTSGNVVNSNVTTQPQAGQDAVCATLAPNGEAYILFVNTNPNDIYKLNSSYSASLWNTSSGTSFVFTEQGNKPYVPTGAFSNGYNCLSANDTFLYFYDGTLLKAYNASNGMQAGTTMTVAGTNLNQGGIYANACNEVFVGMNDGKINKYSFNGSAFTFLATLTVPGQIGNAVHDITYNSVNNLLYVAADNFVATVDPIGNCTAGSAGNINLTYTKFCPDSAKVTITNPSATIGYTFIWQDSTTGANIQTVQSGVGISSNTATGLVPNTTYKVTVIQAIACQVISNVIYFKLSCGDTTVTKCPGDTYTLSNGTVLSTPGIYFDTLTSVITGLDSILTVQFANYTLSNKIINASVCPGQSYILPNGTSTTIAKTYNFTFNDIHLCDSTITVNLSNYTSYNNTVSDAICKGQTYLLPNGNTVNTAGNYQNNFTTIHGCDSIITLALSVYDPPTVFIGNDTTICKETPLKLNGSISNSAATYLWSDNIVTPVREVSNNGTYIVYVTLAPCPIISDTINILTQSCSCIVTIPNAFTPNNDTKNDKFKPAINCVIPFKNYKFSVYNRWGQEVFTSKNALEGWDGFYQGMRQEIGTYMYYLEFFNDGTKQIEKFKGDVILIR